MFSNPVKNIDQCGIQAGQEIADFGSGSGHYTIAAAKALISTGRVYAIDVDQGLLSKLRNHASKEGLYNIEVVLGDVEKAEGSKLRDNSMDLVLICNILFLAEHRDNLINEAKRVLKTGGRVLFVDWTDSFGGIGPHKESVITKQAGKDLFEKHCFHVDREIFAGSHHYGFIFKKL